MAWMWIVVVGSAAGALPEYTAPEARKHIGEKATVVGMVDCIEHGRRHTDLEMGGCLPATLLWVVVPNDVSGPELDCGQLRGVTIAVTGKIEPAGGTPQITIKSTTQIVPRTPLNPDYFSSAMEKQSRGDLDGAIADLDRAVELTHEASIYVQRAEVKQKKGDLDGAISDYDQLLEHYPNEGVYFLNRGRLKMKKSDYAGVVADSSRAIELLTRYYASHPNDHSTFILAQAYSERGEAKEAMSDLAGAIPDYENAVKNDRAPIYKEKLRTAKAEAAAKKFAITQPTAQAAQNEQSSNKDEVTPESIAEAFVQAYSGANVDALASLYADRVDHTNSGVISNAAVRAQAKEYFARWPVRQWSLVGPVKTISLGATKQKVIFSASYDASDPQTNKHASGIAQETLILASDKSGAIKIVSQKEQTSKRSSGQSGESGKKTSEDANFEAAKAEYDTSSHDEATRVRYVTKLADIYYQLLQNDWATGEKRALEGGDLVFEELTKHPAPANSDSKKLSQLLVGEWASPRHGNPYVFRADGKWGRAGGPIDDSWRIKGNQYFARDATGTIDESGTIILLNNDYFIYSDRNHYVTFYSRFQKALADAKRIQKQAEAASQQTPPGRAVSRIVSTEVVDIPSAHADSGIKAGDIKITFGDGRTEVVSKNGNCMQPHVSGKGDVGWIHCTGFDRKGYALNDKIVVRSSDGREKEFKPPARAPFIGEWNFAADGSAIVLQSMSFHGPSSYIRYDLATGKVTNKKDGRDDSEPLPKWAQPLSN